MNNMNVIALPASTNFKPEQALKSAQDMSGTLTDVLVIGYVDGELFIRSSHMTCADALFLVKKAEAWALSGGNP